MRKEIAARWYLVLSPSGLGDRAQTGKNPPDRDYAKADFNRPIASVELYETGLSGNCSFRIECRKGRFSNVAFACSRAGSGAR